MSLRAKRSNLLVSSDFGIFQSGDCFGGSAPPRNDMMKPLIYGIWEKGLYIALSDFENEILPSPIPIP
jgi:hypothetical protein